MSGPTLAEPRHGVLEVNAHARAFYVALGWSATEESREILLGEQRHRVRR